MKFSTGDKLAIAAVLISGSLFILEALPSLTAMIYSMVV